MKPARRERRRPVEDPPEGLDDLAVDRSAEDRWALDDERRPGRFNEDVSEVVCASAMRRRIGGEMRGIW